MSINLTDKNIAQIYYENILHIFPAGPGPSYFDAPIKCPFIPDKIVFKSARLSGLSTAGPIPVTNWITIETNMFGKNVVGSGLNGYQLEGSTFTNLSRNTFSETFRFSLLNDPGELYQLIAGNVHICICFIRYSD